MRVDTYSFVAGCRVMTAGAHAYRAWNWFFLVLLPIVRLRLPTAVRRMDFYNQDSCGVALLVFAFCIVKKMPRQLEAGRDASTNYSRSKGKALAKLH